MTLCQRAVKATSLIYYAKQYIVNTIHATNC